MDTIRFNDRFWVVGRISAFSGKTHLTASQLAIDATSPLGGCLWSGEQSLKPIFAKGCFILKADIRTLLKLGWFFSLWLPDT
ncbi:MAG: hypothetical protein ABJO88_13455 [Parasphingorhabdus sp.]